MSQFDRRDFIKTSVAAATAATVGIGGDAKAQGMGKIITDKKGPLITEDGVRWEGSVCRFCGVGCGIQVGTRDNRVVAVAGDKQHPVNRGLLCAKGYANAQIYYGADRLTAPMLRMEDGEYSKDGQFVQVSWQRAFEEMQVQFLRAHEKLGPSGVGVITSAQATIQEAYAANKLVKAGWRSNNIDSNARAGVASAAAGLLHVFGIDEPIGCFDDIELTDTAILWGTNLAETHPILWARILDRRLGDSNFRIVNITTHHNRCSDLADLEIIIKPQSDLAILNYLYREIIERRAIDYNFTGEYCAFAAGERDIGYGMRVPQRAEDEEFEPLQPEEQHRLSDDEAIAWGLDPSKTHVHEQTQRTLADRHWLMTFSDLKKGVAPYTPEFVTRLAKGDSQQRDAPFKESLRQLAGLFADKKRKIVSFWAAGINQGSRGTWTNEVLHGVHLMTGRHAQAGNNTLPLTGQPSGCGSAREVGAFAGRLPAGLSVSDPADRARAEELWALPKQTLNPKPGKAVVDMMRDLGEDQLHWLWVMGSNPFQSSANSVPWMKAARAANNFIIVSDIYPSTSCKLADLILPSATGVEKWGMYGNAERRTQGWRQQVQAPGRSRGELWQVMEMAKRLRVDQVWTKQPLPGLDVEGFPEGELPDLLEADDLDHDEDDTLYDVLFATDTNKKVVWPDPIAEGRENDTVVPDELTWFPEKALFEEYAAFGREHMHDLANFDEYYGKKVGGLRWPVVEGRETPWRYNALYDPYARERNMLWFYGKEFKRLPRGGLLGIADANIEELEGRAKIFFRPWVEPPEMPDTEFDLWLGTGRVAEHWQSGTLSRRVPHLHRAVPSALMYMHPQDAYERNLATGQLAWIESRRARIKVRVETAGRNRPPRGLVFVPWFDEGIAINKLLLDAGCPIARQSDVKRCAVRVAAVLDYEKDAADEEAESTEADSSEPGSGEPESSEPESTEAQAPEDPDIDLPTDEEVEAALAEEGGAEPVEEPLAPAEQPVDAPIESPLTPSTEEEIEEIMPGVAAEPTPPAAGTEEGTP